MMGTRVLCSERSFPALSAFSFCRQRFSFSGTRRRSWAATSGERARLRTEERCPPEKGRRLFRRSVVRSASRSAEITCGGGERQETVTRTTPIDVYYGKLVRVVSTTRCDGTVLYTLASCAWGTGKSASLATARRRQRQQTGGQAFIFYFFGWWWWWRRWRDERAGRRQFFFPGTHPSAPFGP